MSTPATKTKLAESSLARLRLDITERLTDDIVSARLAPGRKFTLAVLAKWLRVTADVLEPVTPAFLMSGLLVMDGPHFVVAPIDRSALLTKMETRLLIEQSVAVKAAQNASKDHVDSMRADVTLMKRCALLGDIDGYMRSDRNLEKTIGLAAGSPDEFEQLVQIKREFRRAWLAYNRLRELSEPAGLRSALVESIAYHDPEKARLAVTQFLEYLRRSF